MTGYTLLLDTPFQMQDGKRRPHPTQVIGWARITPAAEAEENPMSLEDALFVARITVGRPAAMAHSAAREWIDQRKKKE